MPCMLDRGPVNKGYDEAAVVIAEELAAGRDVAILCEGDPLFYGSFSYLLQRLGDRFPCVVIPGINSVSAAGAAAATPLITGEQRLTVIPATAGDEALRQALLGSDSVAILKPGRHRPRLLELLRETGRTEDVLYIEQASRPAEHQPPSGTGHQTLRGHSRDARTLFRAVLGYQQITIQSEASWNRAPYRYRQSDRSGPSVGGTIAGIDAGCRAPASTTTVSGRSPRTVPSRPAVDSTLCGRHRGANLGARFARQIPGSCRAGHR